MTAPALARRSSRFFAWCAAAVATGRSPRLLLRIRAQGVALLLAAGAAPAATLSAQAPPATDGARARPDVDLRAGPPPSIRFGDVLRIDVRTQVHVDFRDFSPELGEDTAELRRLRVGISGRVVRHVEYEVDAELRDDDQPWRDVLVNYRRYDALQVQGGRFKIPFGREQLTGVSRIDFVERTLMSSTLAPGRDEGVMVHGRPPGGWLAYEAGLFRHDGDNAPESGEAGRTVAGRIVVTPLASRRRVWRELELGVAMTRGTVAEGLGGFTGRTPSGFVFFEPMYVNGRRLRLGAEGSWEPGPFSLRAEYIRVQDARAGQGLFDVDLPDAVAEGYYVSGTWVVTGERKAGGVRPRAPFLQEGPGAIEVGVRFEALQFGSRATPGEPATRDPRAATILVNRDRLLTLGVTWYLNRLARIMVNGTREAIDDVQRSPVARGRPIWGVACRLQFAL